MSRPAPRHARPRRPHRAALGSLALLGAASAVGGAVGLGLQLTGTGGGASPAAEGVVPGLVAAQPGTPPEGTATRPRSLSIPAIGVRTSLESLGLTAAGSLATPARPAEAGWFRGGPLPGAPGPAVVVGHVDSLTGPAVFSRLSLLRARDLVTVALSDGTTARFQVTSVRRYPKDRFPTAEVYGPQPDPQLRLITCGGTYDGHAYLDNVVVFARLAPGRAAA